MKLLHISILLICLAACQQPGTEKQAHGAADSVASFIHDMRDSVKKYPEDSEARMYLANALIEDKQFAAADSQALFLAKDSATLDKAHYIKALIALHQKDTLATIAHLTKAITQAKMHSEYEAVMMLGDLLVAKQQMKEASAYYLLAQQMDSLSAEAQYGYGYTQEMLKDKKMASSRYLRAAELDPAFGEAYIGLGRIAEQEKATKDALRYYNMAAKADPTDAEAFYLRGKVLLQLGNKDAGLDDLTKALSFRKNYPEAKALLDSVKSKQ